MSEENVEETVEEPSQTEQDEVQEDNVADEVEKLEISSAHEEAAADQNEESSVHVDDHQPDEEGTRNNESRQSESEVITGAVESEVPSSSVAPHRPSTAPRRSTVDSEVIELQELRDIPEDRITTGHSFSTDDAALPRVNEARGDSQLSNVYSHDEGVQHRESPNSAPGVHYADPKNRAYPDFMNFSPKRTHGLLPPKAPLDLVWTFGFNVKAFAGLHYIGSFADQESELIFYVSGHTGVIYDRLQNEQFLLQGHNNAITSTCISANRQWIATCDSGPDGMIIIWDTRTRIPTRTFFADQLEGGVISLDMSHDAMYLVTLGGGVSQKICLWDWTDDSQSTPILSVSLPATTARQTRITFHAEDPRQLITVGDSQVVFYSWTHGGSLNYNLPNVSSIKDCELTFGPSLFISDYGQAITATRDGRIVVWQQLGSDWSAFKLMKIADSPVTTITYSGQYLVFGLENGVIRFTDTLFKLISWNDKINLGSITAISFAPSLEEDKLNKTGRGRTAELRGREFVIPNYIVATTKGVVVYVAPGFEDWMTVVVRSQDSAVVALATHPSRKLLAVTSYSGALRVWNYETRELELSAHLPDGRMPQCMEYSPNGAILAIGLTNGLVVLLDALTLTPLANEESEFRVAREMVNKLVFSKNSQYLAFADNENCVGYLQKSKSTSNVWTFIGRYKSHTKPVVDVTFDDTDSLSKIPRLFSVGQDRMLVEYDLVESSFDGGLKLKGARVRAEQSALPTALIWFPKNGKESFLMTANSQYKFKFYNGQTRLCRRTTLGPIFTQCVDRLVPVFQNGNCHILAFAANNKIGVTLMPVDGNIHRHMATIAHPGKITSLVVSNDGNHIFTSGEGGAGVHLWQVNPGSLGAAARLGGESLDPFLNMLEGGKNGEFLNQLEDYFYYAQIRSQGEDSMEKRNVTDTIPIEQVPFVFRALGCFLSEFEISDLLNEIKYSRFAETHEFVTDVNISQFIQLYINHRPAQGIDNNVFTRAFQVLSQSADGVEADVLVQALLTRGEKLTDAELAQHLTSLLGEGNIATVLNGSFTAERFTKSILGFVHE